jgi:hypothetical protein
MGGWGDIPEGHIDQISSFYPISPVHRFVQAKPNCQTAREYAPFDQQSIQVQS